MSTPKTRVLTMALAAGLAMSIASADDGLLLRRNISNTPDYETEFAGINVAQFYVPAQASDGTLLTEGIVYQDFNEDELYTRLDAKPLVSVYTDGVVTGITGVGFIGHGKRDIYGAVSFDDGATWKKTNLSNTGTKKFKVLTEGRPFFYYGDVIRAYSAMAGNKVMAIWASRYCDQGDPAYLLAGLDGAEGEDTDPLSGQPYRDLFGVRGQQGYVEYPEYPQIGPVPYACVWTARGTIEADPDTGGSLVLWRKAERLTSGVRDAHRIEVSCALNAGCAVTWQEDPEGLRPGDGEGPGEGWSGAVAHKGTDVWYSFMDWANFDAVVDVDGNLVEDPLSAEGALKPAVPMAIPVRLTDNEKCSPGDTALPYCYGDIDGDGLGGDLCTEESISYTNKQQATVEACVTVDGRVMNGQTAATRPRIALQAFQTGGADTVEDESDDTYSAWTVLAYEENKALGELDADDDGFIDEAPELPAEIGKNVRYVSFEFNKPEVLQQNLQLNPPYVNWETGEFIDLEQEVGCYTEGSQEIDGLLICDTLYDTEIARRASLMVQAPGKVAASDYKLAAMPLFKQGIVNQGGPADIMARRFVAPDGFDPAIDNPYDEENMVCSDLRFADGSNPNYLNGLCVDAAINLSGTMPIDCEGSIEGCVYPFLDDPDFVDDDSGESIDVPKVLTWDQRPEELASESSANPMEVAKGHRGFLDKDFVMVLYAWSPNWKANADGHDQYNLYVRRSFDGGVTWTTTPGLLGGNGTTTCEIFRDDTVECTLYGAGEFEKARNVSLLTSLQTTVLDPRYAPAGSFDPDGDGTLDFPEVYDDDIRDPSRFAIVYETGDNATVALGGEATPLDLFYAQAVSYGDYYTGLPHTLDTATPTYIGETPLYVMPQFDALEGSADLLSGEASLSLSPSGTFLHSVWNQWQETADGDLYNSDAWFRRVIFIDEIENPTATGGGGGGGTNPGGGKKPRK